MEENLKQRNNLGKKNERRFSRVNTYLPFAVRLVPLKERKLVKSRIAKSSLVVDFTMSPPVNEPVLAEWLLKLNNKLDTIIHLLSPETKGFLPINFRIMNISGNGMRFTSKNTYKIGDFLEIQMVLYPYPYQVIYLYWKVVRLEPGDSDNYSIAIEFTHLDEDVRQEVMNFDFKKHREKLQRIIESKSIDNLIMLK